MLETIYILIALAGSLAIALWDLKTSDVPDNACYFMIGSGLVLHAAEAAYTGRMNLLTDTLMYTAAFFIFGYLMYRTGQWGGGDAAMLVAIGALLSNIPSAALPFSISYFINLTVIGAVYSIIYSIIIARANGSDRIFFNDIKKDSRIILGVTAATVLASAAAVFATGSILLLAAPLAVFSMLIFYIFIKAVDKGFRRKISVSKLKVGDVVWDSVAGMKGKVITGITAAQLAKIKKTLKYVTVVDGIRYTPAFFLTLAFTLLYGNVLSALFL